MSNWFKHIIIIHVYISIHASPNTHRGNTKMTFKTTNIDSNTTEILKYVCATAFGK